ncbi:MAG: hypothetical protein EA345_12465 [Halomonas sp.]|nr:hypothetical protein [Halomonas sp.]TVP46643.1 MAG: hypothetical protein EA345_12465 [Halomonas sp.]
MVLAVHFLLFVLIVVMFLSLFYWSRVKLYFSSDKVFSQFNGSVDVIRELSENEKDKYSEVFGGDLVSDKLYRISAKITKIRYKRFTQVRGSFTIVNEVKWCLGRLELNKSFIGFFENFKNVEGVYDFVLMKELIDEDIYPEIIAYPAENPALTSHVCADIPTNMNVKNVAVDDLGTKVINRRHAIEEERESLSCQHNKFYPTKYFTLIVIAFFSSFLSFFVMWMLGEFQFFYFSVAMMFAVFFVVFNMRYAPVPKRQAISSVKGYFSFKKGGLHIGDLQCALPKHMKNHAELNSCLDSWVHADVCRYNGEYMLLSVNGHVIHEKKLELKREIAISLAVVLGVMAAILSLVFLLVG